LPGGFTKASRLFHSHHYTPGEGKGDVPTSQSSVDLWSETGQEIQVFKSWGK